MDTIFQWMKWLSTLLVKLPCKLFTPTKYNGHIISAEDRIVLNNSLSLHDETQHDNNLFLLPDEIITDILSRLDTESADWCHHVCTRFSKIMSTPSFISMHRDRNRGKPIIAVLCFTECCLWIENQITNDIDQVCKCKIPLCLIDYEGKDEIVEMIAKFKLNYMPKSYPYMPDLIGSYHGFLLLKHEDEGALIVFNPITKEKVLVNFPSPNYEFCGFYFHPPTSEYRILYMLQQLNEPCRFFVYSLKTKLLREISNHTMQAPCTCRPPAILNGALHWMSYVGDQSSCIDRISADCSKSILVFKMDSEKFIVMPHPGSQCYSKENHRTRMYLLEMEGQLCFCDISLPIEEEYNAEIYIWILKDFTEQIWVRKYIVGLAHISKFDYDFHCSPFFEVLQIHNNELLLRKGHYELFCYHLILGTFRKVDMARFNLNMITSLVVHTHSKNLISWQDFKK